MRKPPKKVSKRKLRLDRHGRRKFPEGSHGNFCRNVKALRKDRHWSQESLGYALGMTRNHVTDIERGRNSPTLDLVDRFARALKVTSSFLLDSVEHNFPAHTS